ncbi:MAG: ArgE/DapE family deacylase [Actinobacteria bacterium]|nr:MAG: ArgE/DapE family deacylase [Actinomycetota bacterium]
MVDDATLLAAVAEQRADMERLLVELVEAPTVLGSEAPGQAIMRRAFAGLGLEPVDVALDPQALRDHPGASPFSWDVSGKQNVTAVWPPAEPADGRSLILNGHIDVVSPEPAVLWSRGPFAATRDGDWLYGRGAGDMKAGLAAIVGAVGALQRLGLAPRGRIELQSVVEEECTGHGALACVLAGRRADAAVITEPTGGAVWTSQVGVLWFQVRVLGRPAHAGEARAGENAIEATFPVVRALRALEAELNAHPPPPYDAYPNPINLNVGIIRGGDWASTVAGECVTHCRLALYPDDHVGNLRRRVEAAVAAARADPAVAGFDVEVRYDGFARDGYSIAADAPPVGALRVAAERAFGVAPAVVASTATTDASILQLYGGTPAMCFGPYAESIHGVDERVHLPSMVQTAQALALFIRDWCGLKPAA